jgi:hypothetical protein
MLYDNLSSVSQNVLKFYHQLTGEENSSYRTTFVYRRTDEQTDGHGETSIPPYNFVAGGIIMKYTVKMCISQKNIDIKPIV